tara:strand:+ start:8871 stop:9089 length:219 start_codon:yes stop_codon:yes gene_type:complete
LNSREKANQANAILNNEVFKEVIENIHQGLISKWTISETINEREECWLKLDALRSITEDLEALIHNDKIENN